MDRTLKRRLATAAVLLPAAVALLLWASVPVLLATVAAVVLLAGHEWGRLGCTGLLTPLLAGLLVLTWWGGAPLAVPVLVVGALWWVIAAALLVRGGERWPAGRAAHALLGVLILLPAWTAVMVLVDHPAGRVVLLGALALVWVADSAAYFAGRAFGRRRLAPHISPGKTVEGACAGLAGAAVAGVALGLIAGGALWWWTLLAVIAAAVSVVGDLTESLIKRRAGVKDSGALLPGHGGVLDRIDALTAALPVFALGQSLYTSLNA